jgi:hypothetical protein
MTFSTIASASDSVRQTQGRPAAFAEMLSMVCPHNYEQPCKNESLAQKPHGEISNTVRMYNKLMCGKSFCGAADDAKLAKMIK